MQKPCQKRLLENCAEEYYEYKSLDTGVTWVRCQSEMEDGRFKYRQIVFCWPRGEGKSFVTCLIQSWKFFCWPRQQIMLGANSKDQVKFVHYDIMKDLILNSPKLVDMISGKKNVESFTFHQL